MEYNIKDIGKKNDAGLKKALDGLDSDIRMMMGLKKPATLKDLKDLLEILYENLYIHAQSVSPVSKGSPRPIDPPKAKKNKYTTTNAIRKLLKERKWPKDQIETAVKELS